MAIQHSPILCRTQRQSSRDYTQHRQDTKHRQVVLKTTDFGLFSPNNFPMNSARTAALGRLYIVVWLTHLYRACRHRAPYYPNSTANSVAAVAEFRRFADSNLTWKKRVSVKLPAGFHQPCDVLLDIVGYYRNQCRLNFLKKRAHFIDVQIVSPASLSTSGFKSL